MNILITGAAGNLGSLLAKHLIDDVRVQLHLMIHKKDVPAELKRENIQIVRADLSDPSTLPAALEGIDVVVHFAGILFKQNPEKFLPVTNTVYFRNLTDEAIRQNVKRIILISFPHVEGDTTPEQPASGRLDAKPKSVHAQTRLEEEKYLFRMAETHSFEAVSLRVGMVYGKGILMIEGARWFARKHMLGVWKEPTQIHLISTIDFLEATANAAILPGIRGIYHLGDEGKQTLQDLLDTCCTQWGYRKPLRMPVWLIMTAARVFETWSWISGARSPLTRDFIRIGLINYYGDTKRMREELLTKLKYPTLKEGSGTL